MAQESHTETGTPARRVGLLAIKSALGCHGFEILFYLGAIAPLPRLLIQPREMRDCRCVMSAPNLTGKSSNTAY
jgi:hypothetical protein